METFILSNEPLPDTGSTIALDFFDPKDRGSRGTRLPQRKEREGKITFNPDGCQIFSLSSQSEPDSAQITARDSIPGDLYLIRVPFTLHKMPGAGYYQEI